jgi:hypothetical protein
VSNNPKHLQQFSKNVTLPYEIDERIKLRTVMGKDARLEPWGPNRLTATKAPATGKKARYYERPAFCSSNHAREIGSQESVAVAEVEPVNDPVTVRTFLQKLFKGCA